MQVLKVDMKAFTRANVCFPS